MIAKPMKMLAVSAVVAGLALGPAADATADTTPGGSGSTTPTADTAAAKATQAKPGVKIPKPTAAPTAKPLVGS